MLSIIFIILMLINIHNIHDNYLFMLSNEGNNGILYQKHLVIHKIRYLHLYIFIYIVCIYIYYVYMVSKFNLFIIDLCHIKSYNAIFFMRKKILEGVVTQFFVNVASSF